MVDYDNADLEIFDNTIAFMASLSPSQFEHFMVQHDGTPTLSLYDHVQSEAALESRCVA